jgi:hypothetical protein
VCTLPPPKQTRARARWRTLITEKTVRKSDISDAYANMCMAPSMSTQAEAEAERRKKDKQECRFRKLLASQWQVELKKLSKSN